MSRSRSEEYFERSDTFWRDLFSDELPALRRGRNVFKLLSPGAVARCRMCFAPFEGMIAPLVRWFGRGPWHRNPHYCAMCERLLREHRGGAELDIAVIFADVRASTQIAASMPPAEFGALMQRFYLAASRVFIETDGVIDKMVGDEVIGLYFPGITKAEYRRAAVRAGIDLLRATSGGSAQAPWLSIGIGVHAGKAFVGSLGAEGGSYEFVALGDTMNRGARLAAAAKGGEMIISDAVWPHVAGDLAADQRHLKLKGVAQPVQAYVVRI